MLQDQQLVVPCFRLPPVSYTHLDVYKRQPLAFTNVEPITLVNFAGINNTTSPVLNGTPSHEDFTSITGNIARGGTYPITLKGNTAGGFTNTFVVFIDWNQNGNFNDADAVSYTHLDVYKRQL